ncbi:hypothetical protein RFI_27184 [Reticulomyxa filosa]|uniref:Uncharacterized protein n=1 Tax=Reticulomyxa filosa TaxID=46433 RepID=X6M8E7_RETFI|nr:hypothetical protein RFI_27184 [Reticulomyxa filosa]|eukprot:ETO10194.1 hypothetical protein RFI_27184 [Reticulomyxa filosa]
MFVVPLITFVMSLFMEVSLLWFFISFGAGVLCLVGFGYYLRRPEAQIYEYLDYCDVCQNNFPIIDGFVNVECPKQHTICLDCYEENAKPINAFVKRIENKPVTQTDSQTNTYNPMDLSDIHVGNTMKHMQVFQIDKSEMDILNESNDDNNDNDDDDNDDNDDNDEAEEKHGLLISAVETHANTSRSGDGPLVLETFPEQKSEDANVVLAPEKKKNKGLQIFEKNGKNGK